MAKLAILFIAAWFHAIAPGSTATPGLAGGPLCVDDDVRSGLRAEYRSGETSSPVVRIDSDVQFDWADASPDPRVSAGRFDARWQGKLLATARGPYRFHIFVTGTAGLRIDGKSVIAGTKSDAGWLSSSELTLDLGDHAVEVTFSKAGPHARIGLYWESQKFGLEPIGPRWLSHDRSERNEPGDFERGSELVEAFRCAACHSIPGVGPARAAPALDHLPAQLRPEWLVRWLARADAGRETSHMPQLSLTPDEARSVVHFLISSAAAGPKPTPPSGRSEAGEAVFQSVGCVACHSLDGVGHDGAFGGGPLDLVGDKRPMGFFRDWLTKPESINAAHRMPIFTLKKEEVDDLAAYLATRKRAAPAAPAWKEDRSEAMLRVGRSLVAKHRCAACHHIPGIDRPDVVAGSMHGGRGRGNAIDWSRGCLDAPGAAGRPGFDLGADRGRAIRAFIEQLPAQVDPQSEYERGRRLLGEFNCTGCHARDLGMGLEPSLAARGDARDAEASLAKLRGELEPPCLTAVGDKFRDETLSQLVRGGLTPRRPWLKVRMPRFTMSDVERDALLSFLVGHDRIPTPPPVPVIAKLTAPGDKGRAGSGANQTPVKTDATVAVDPSEALLAAHQLVSSRGFGCMSCHTLGKHEPKNVAVNARGSDLLKMGDRVRREWFMRWMRDPARIVPGMEMPAITVAARGVLNDRLDSQFDALWQGLNSTAFVVPSERDTSQQVLSLAPGDEPVVLRDVIQDCPPGSGWCAHAFAIGLPNRHNVLFDLDTMSLRAWWVGDFARERTQGKTWLWEPGGLPAWARASKVPAVALRDSNTGELLLPVPNGQSVGRLLEWSIGPLRDSATESRVGLSYCLNFLNGLEVNVHEGIRPMPRSPRAGFERNVSISRVPDGYRPVLLFHAAEYSKERQELIATGPIGEIAIGRRRGPPTEFVDQPQLKLADDDRCFAMECARESGNTGAFSASMAYWSTASDGPRAPALPVAPPRVEARSLAVVPGCDAVRLPLDSNVMPTAIAFRSDATPVVCSLKGGVFLALDTDHDGLADAWETVSDHLAAPFGVLVDGDDVLVCQKPELVRLLPRVFPGQPAPTKVVATGWGYTEDYHDWTFGLVRDSQRNLYIGTGSDYTHKDRPAAARKWRGCILKVAPDGRIEELAHGARYPTGIAITRDDQVFFTDNQGVQNTFNEINHVVPGSRYGVPALGDPAPDQDPWPERVPAIQIPHPWTRSINGICFLDANGKWGPFEGHGVGCEYDTRSLIRFSLQKIGDTYQGACYPFASPEDQVPPEQRFLGPLCCAVDPHGDLYVGGLRDSGWGGGNNVGELVRVRPGNQWPLGIREVRAWRAGFVIEFTGPIDPERAEQLEKYSIASYRRIWKGTYATPDSDRRVEKIQRVRVTPDRRMAVIELDSMRSGFVYELHVGDVSASGPLWPADAYYTLNEIPDEDSQKD
jgi:mono/diheme cytochrome c family protein/glucose/arabinose dehydrogenase